MMRIDAHHHLWRYNPDEFGWIDDRMQVLRRDFLPADLDLLMGPASVDATVVVQARQTLEETDWLLQTSAQSPGIVGVIGWGPIASPAFPRFFDTITISPLLKGLRHVVQAEPAGFLDEPAFNAGITTLTHHDLTYDLLVLPLQLPETIRFVDRHPNQRFVLDHLAKPDIANRGFTTWSYPIRELALRPNVVCKLSGMVTEADWQSWTPPTCRPYVDHILQTFGPSRLMAASDWPVLNLAADYVEWWKLIETWIAPLSQDEQADIEGAVAARTYKLDLTRGSPA